MSDPYFFGYGSLVNRNTHAFGDAFRARLKGWRRAWRHTSGHAVPFLTGVPCAASEIDGLIARVPGADWAALDRREQGYDRHVIASGLTHEATGPVSAQIYAVPPASVIAPVAPAPILLSYLDVVVQGYLREFGEMGAVDFFDTTDGWETAVVDDRAAPRYPRHQRLDAFERGFVAHHLRTRRVRILPA